MKKIIVMAICCLYGFGYAQSIWFEGFEGTTFPPAGWNVLNIAGTKTWERYTLNNHSGTGSARHEFAVGTQTSALITPPITIPNYGSPELNFWSYVQLIGYQYSGILVSTTVNNDINAFTEIKVLSGDEAAIGSWKNIIVPLDNYLGQTIYIAFMYDNNDGHNWTVDDINIMHFAGYVDMQALSLTPKTGEYPILSNNEQVTVRLKNNGGNSASGFTLKLLHNGNIISTEIFTGTIPSLGESAYTFNFTLNLSATGIHKIQAVVEITGDQVSANDTATSFATHLGCSVLTTFPYFEGFEEHGNNFPPCWTQEHVSGTQNWQVMSEEYAQGIPGLYPKEAYEGNYKMVFYQITHITKLIMPPMNFNALANPVLKFHHIQRRYVNDQDSLKIYYKTSATGEWVFLEKYTTMVEDWTERVIPLPNPSNQYYIAFEGYGEWGHSIQLDNISVGYFFDTDIAVTAITPSGVHVGLSAQQTVTATIKNNGRNPVTNFDITLYLNETGIATEHFTGTIPGLEESIYTFNATVDLSVSGTYFLKVVADLEGDEVPENNELTVTVKNLVCDALTFPYEEGFEEEIFPPHCWINKGTEWDRLTYSAHTGIGRARHKWWDGAQDGWLISPKFSISEEGEFLLEFCFHVYDKKFFTYSGIWISTTNTELSSFTEVHSLGGDEIPDEEWIKIQFPLSAYAGKDIHIAFRYKTTGGQSGHIWSLDDILVYDLNPHIDAELVAITAPPDVGVNLTNAEDVTVRVKNNSGTTISNFQLILELNGTVVATEIYTGFINSLATANYTFTKKLDLSAAGIYSVKVTVALEGDMDPSNNSKTKTVENRVCEVVTHFPWYGAFQGTAPGSIDNCWINRDADGDTKKWWSLEETGKYYAISESYDAQYEFPLAPDNWLITPPLALNKACLLSYKVGGVNSGTNGAEKYSVLVSTTNIEPASFMPLHSEILSSYDYTEWLGGSLSGYGVKTVNIPLSSYTGKTVHLAFRHWDCTHQDMLILTDILVKETLSVTEITGDELPLVAWVYNDNLYVKGLQAGDHCNVYSVTGQLIYTQVAHNELMSFKLNSRGFYIIQSGLRVAKVVY